MSEDTKKALREAVARLQSVQFTPEIDPGVRGWIEDGKLVAAALPALLDELEKLRTCNEILRRNNLTLKDDSHALDVLRVEQRQLIDRWNKANIEREDNAQRLVAEVTKAEAELATWRARTCETCRFRERDYCLNEKVGSDLFEVECAVVKFCGAWAAKERV